MCIFLKAPLVVDCSNVSRSLGSLSHNAEGSNSFFTMEVHFNYQGEFQSLAKVNVRRSERYSTFITRRDILDNVVYMQFAMDYVEESHQELVIMAEVVSNMGFGN